MNRRLIRQVKHRGAAAKVRRKYYVPVSKEVVSATEYLDAVEKRTDTIESSRFILPVHGEKGFGSFEVKYRNPILKEATD